MFSNRLNQTQKTITKFLSLAIANNRLAQGYVLVGNNNSDKLQSAKEIAQILNCETNSYNTCFNIKDNLNRICNNCNWLNDFNHPKCLNIFSLKDGESKIKIESVRALREDLSLTSQFYKIIYFDNASKDVLHSPSGNALLKILEEPAVNVLFLFSVDKTDDILITLKSRCQILYFADSAKSLLEPNYEFIKSINEINSTKFRFNEIEILEFNKLLENILKDYCIKDLAKYLVHNQFNFHKDNLHYLEKLNDLVIKFLEYDQKYVNKASNIANFVDSWHKLAIARL